MVPIPRMSVCFVTRSEIQTLDLGCLKGLRVGMRPVKVGGFGVGLVYSCVVYDECG